ncbi:hypothetical protein [Geodermatophilus sp. SYSU D00710]
MGLHASDVVDGQLCAVRVPLAEELRGRAAGGSAGVGSADERVELAGVGIAGNAHGNRLLMSVAGDDDD